MPEQATLTLKDKVVWSGFRSVIMEPTLLAESAECNPKTLVRVFDAHALRFARAEPAP
jgi:hypothetical protein